MGNLRLCLVVGLAACGSNNSQPDAHIVVVDAAPDAKVFMDAPPPMFDTSCIGNSPPAVAATVSFSGTVQQASLSGIMPVQGATVDACIGNCVGNNKLDTKTSDAQGAFTLGPLTTGGTAINGFARMTKTGLRTTYAYPHAPIAADVTGVPILTFPPTVIALLGMAGCTQNDAANGIVALVVNDCMGNRITDSANLTIAVKQNNAAVGDAPIDLGGLNAMGAGLYLICNVPENATTNVSASYKGMAFLAHDVGMLKGTTTETDVRPGY